MGTDITVDFCSVPCSLSFMQSCNVTQARSQTRCWRGGEWNILKCIMAMLIFDLLRGAKIFHGGLCPTWPPLTTGLGFKVALDQPNVIMNTSMWSLPCNSKKLVFALWNVFHTNLTLLHQDGEIICNLQHIVTRLSWHIVGKLWSRDTNYTSGTITKTKI